MSVLRSTYGVFGEVVMYVCNHLPFMNHYWLTDRKYRD